MKKIIAIICVIAMLMSMAAITVVAWDGAAYTIGSAEEFYPVGQIDITWDPDASKKLDLTDGDMADWAEAGYSVTTIGPENMISWTGFGDKVKDHNGQGGYLDPGMPEGWNISSYFVADENYLYVGFYVTDPDFCYGTTQNYYNGDAFQIAIDFGGKLGEKVEQDPDSLTNQKNIFYSFCCIEDGLPLEFHRQESDMDGLISEENGDGVKGAARATLTGWSAEFAMSWEQLYNDYVFKAAWGENPTIYMGGVDNKPLKIGISLYYLDRSAGKPGANGIYNWGAGTLNGMVDETGMPICNWTPAENGIKLEMPVQDGMELNCFGIKILGEDETEGDGDEFDVTEPPTVEVTEPVTEAPTETPTEEIPETEAPTEPEGTEKPEEVTTAPEKQGCGSVLGISSVIILAAAAYVLKKKS